MKAICKLLQEEKSKCKIYKCLCLHQLISSVTKEFFKVVFFWNMNRLYPSTSFLILTATLRIYRAKLSHRQIATQTQETSNEGGRGVEV